MEQPIIEFQQVDMAFGPKVVLDKVSFSVKKGETLAVIGPSGTGKSTVLKLLIGLLKPQGGHVVIQGKNVENYDEKQWNALRQHMGMVFQYSALFDFLDVSENVAFGLRQHTKLKEDAIQQRVSALLAAVGLSGNEHVYPAALSGGMQKRVGLARALALQPDIILYDEPTAGLDPIMATNISQLILEAKKRLGITSLLVTHDMASAFLCADRVLMLSEGHIVFSGTVSEAKRTQQPLVRAFIRSDIYEDTGEGSK
ncbi:ABC transporter ATP-binding protein [Acidaminococcus sp. NSJ-142]|jgi:phospholipid/cholesterol/gamma-HCH transport system ATP-binding protein|uniref:ABC transporter ATP-binding protein n=1 Tax=Acidaminococcus TaxID=904 RepID=UPI000CF97E30|nr:MULTISPECIES: ABC transporter ATP-binding protein [Acidaminococcus]MCD2435217.1 ABC transporter ATP-binding protein [Acidaminococcus hominis]MCH4097184.1 ABC transporter ATP-binding protein [Acidaminococcus provencensis]RHK02087.1 ABC transporter ATP-binding protein [Acidaminococcus sp. AM05-11]